VHAPARTPFFFFLSFCFVGLPLFVYEAKANKDDLELSTGLSVADTHVRGRPARLGGRRRHGQKACSVTETRSRRCHRAPPSLVPAAGQQRAWLAAPPTKTARQPQPAPFDMPLKTGLCGPDSRPFFRWPKTPASRHMPATQEPCWRAPAEPRAEACCVLPP
jgi:hypothetical protein